MSPPHSIPHISYAVIILTPDPTARVFGRFGEGYYGYYLVPEGSNVKNADAWITTDIKSWLKIAELQVGGEKQLRVIL